jgi:hypothetical protein
MRKSLRIWWPGRELSDSALPVISKLLIAQRTRRAAKTCIVCVLCAILSVQDTVADPPPTFRVHMTNRRR